MPSLTDHEIGAACDQHGAKAVSDAAYRAMQGDRTALDRVGLGAASGLSQLHRITTVAFSLMAPKERAGDLADASIALARRS